MFSITAQTVSVTTIHFCYNNGEAALGNTVGMWKRVGGGELDLDRSHGLQTSGLDEQIFAPISELVN